MCCWLDIKRSWKGIKKFGIKFKTSKIDFMILSVDNYDRYELEFIVEKGVVYLKADDNTVYNFKAYKIGGALLSAGYISGYDVNSIFRLRIYNN